MKTVQELRSDCTGCSACRSICPVHAITMKPDQEGFLVPVIDLDLCTECGQCRSICPMQKESHYKEKEAPKFYVAHHESGEVLSRSTSGGAFTSLSDCILERGGVVYGADFDDSLQICHRRAEDKAGRDRMRFSKYVQSEIGDAFEQVKTDLAAGREVLFTGTPCQTAGLRALVGCPENLITCDLVCHGVPSALVWNAYLDTLAAEQSNKVTWVSFRTKANGWYRGQYKIYYKVAGRDDVLEDGRFFPLYFKWRYLLRPSCHACPFADIRRAADLTIADYWGIEKYSEQWCDRRGTSLILVNTEKGQKLLEESPNLLYEQRAPEEALAEQKRLHGPVEPAANRQEFWDLFSEKGFAAAYDEIAAQQE